MLDALKQYGEQVREAAAKVAVDRHKVWHDGDGHHDAEGFEAVNCDVSACRNIAAAIKAMPLPEPAPAQADELAELRARLAAAEQAARERGEALRVYANLQHRIPYGEWMDMKKRIDAWVAAGMRPGELPELPEWAKEGRGDD